MAKGSFLKKEALADETMQKIKALNEVAASRGQTLAEIDVYKRQLTHYSLRKKEAGIPLLPHRQKKGLSFAG